jgi:deoxyadenosine/deoxycytidine kinase
MCSADGDLKQLFISISGLIGAGKTHLADDLGRALKLPVYNESVNDKKYLEDFYRDPAKYGLRLQFHLLNNRFRQHQKILWNGKGAVQDRTIYEDTVFVNMLVEAGFLEERDRECYLSLLSSLSNLMAKPSVIVHLDVSAETAYKRIQARGRECEKGITLEYLSSLKDQYEKFIEQLEKTTPVVRLDWETFGNVEDVITAINEKIHIK